MTRVRTPLGSVIWLILAGWLSVATYNLLIMLIGLELIVLGVSLFSVLCSVYLDDAYGLMLVVVIITVSAAETAVGLAAIIGLLTLRQSLSLDTVLVHG